MLPFVLDMSLWSIMQQRLYFSEFSFFSVVEKKVRSMPSQIMLKNISEVDDKHISNCSDQIQSHLSFKDVSVFK